MLGNTQLAEAKQSQQNITMYQGGVNNASKMCQKEVVICVFSSLQATEGWNSCIKMEKVKKALLILKHNIS